MKRTRSGNLLHCFCKSSLLQGDCSRVRGKPDGMFRWSGRILEFRTACEHACLDEQETLSQWIDQISATSTDGECALCFGQAIWPFSNLCKSFKCLQTCSAQVLKKLSIVLRSKESILHKSRDLKFRVGSGINCLQLRTEATFSVHDPTTQKNAFQLVSRHRSSEFKEKTTQAASGPYKATKENYAITTRDNTETGFVESKH